MKHYDDTNYQDEGVRQSLIDYVNGCTIKERAILYYNHYKWKKDPRINKDESQYTILLSLKQDAKEWKHWHDLFFAIKNYSNVLGMFALQWGMDRDYIVGMMDTYDALKVIKEAYEGHINALGAKVARMQEIAQCRQCLSQMKTLYGASIFIKVDDEAHITIDISGYLSWIRSEIKGTERHLMSAKTSIMALEAFCRTHRCKDFVDDITKGDCTMVKSDGARRHPEWSSKELKKREAKGEHITDEERAMAIFPYYDDVPKIDDFYSQMMNQLRQFYYFSKNNQDEYD